VIFKKKDKGEYHPQRVPKYDKPLNSVNLKEIFKNCDDFTVRDVFIGGNPQHRVKLCFIDGIVSGEAVSREILTPLTDPIRFSQAKNDEQRFELIAHGGVSSRSMLRRDNLDDTVGDLVSGFCALVFDEKALAVVFEVRSGEKRAVTEPATEKVIKGAKDAFVESIRTNTSLVRRKLRDPELKILETYVGRHSHTRIAVVYAQGIADMNIVAQVRRKIDEIDVDAVLTSAMIEEYLVDSKKTMFPLMLTTERADKFSMNIMEGRVGILVDGLPIGYMVPATMAQTLFVPEDRARHFAVATVILIIRYLAVLLTLLLPAFYVAVAMYHQEMLPTKLLLSIIESKQNVPFSTAAEVLAMLVAFELLQEAGLQLPEPVGQTVSIIGALIVGQSAVEARVLSPVVVIVVAMAGVAGYAMPNQDMAAALRVWRFILAVSAMLGGMFGLMIAAVLLVYHLATLESFGVPYMSPFVGRAWREAARRSVIRLPMPEDKYRDKALNTPNRRKQK